MYSIGRLIGFAALLGLAATLYALMRNAFAALIGSFVLLFVALVLYRLTDNATVAAIVTATLGAFVALALRTKARKWSDPLKT